MLRFINQLIPKNKKYIYLRSYYEYRDNIHSILDEILSLSLNHFYYIICDGDAFKNYKDKNIKKPKNRILLLYFFMRSKYVFFDVGLYKQMSPVKGQIMVNTWHGVSLKKIGYYLNNYNNNSGKRLATYLTVYSDFFIDKMSYAFGVPKTHVLVTGEPRNDCFFKLKTGQSLKKIGIDKNNYSKVIIWMPTYRKHKYTKSLEGNSYLHGIPFVNNLEKFNEFLKTYNVLLIIKLHGLEDLDMEINYENIVNISSTSLGLLDVSVNELLVDCDALITDYSSVYINYLLLNRPICFAYDDIEEYKNNRGFMFENVENIMPGFHAHNLKDIKSFVIDVFSNRDVFVSDRLYVNKLLNKYSDDNNSFRVLNMIGLINNYEKKC